MALERDDTCRCLVRRADRAGAPRRRAGKIGVGHRAEVGADRAGRLADGAGVNLDDRRGEAVGRRDGVAGRNQHTANDGGLVRVEVELSVVVVPVASEAATGERRLLKGESRETRDDEGVCARVGFDAAAGFTRDLESHLRRNARPRRREAGLEGFHARRREVGANRRQLHVADDLHAVADKLHASTLEPKRDVACVAPRREPEDQLLGDELTDLSVVDGVGWIAERRHLRVGVVDARVGLVERATVR